MKIISVNLMFLKAYGSGAQGIISINYIVKEAYNYSAQLIKFLPLDFCGWSSM
jgi:hypothetical protein